MKRNILMFGYACIIDPTMSKTDYERIYSTKTCKQLKQSLDRMFVFPVDISVDVLSGAKRKRHGLIELVQWFKEHNVSFALPHGIIFIQNLSALGTSAAIAYENYKMLLREGIGLYIIDDGYYAGGEAVFLTTTTTDGKLLGDKDELEKQAEKILLLKMASNRGREKLTREFSDDFKRIYWLYEHYMIPETLAYNNSVIGKMSRYTFRQLCEDYEHSASYYEDEKMQDGGNRFCPKTPISSKPKRFGKAPDGFSEISLQVDNGEMSREDACKKLNISEISFDRFKHKGEGKKAMSEATLLYKDDAIIAQLQP